MGDVPADDPLEGPLGPPPRLGRGSPLRTSSRSSSPACSTHTAARVPRGGRRRGVRGRGTVGGAAGRTVLAPAGCAEPRADPRHLPHVTEFVESRPRPRGADERMRDHVTVGRGHRDRGREAGGLPLPFVAASPRRVAPRSAVGHDSSSHSRSAALRSFPVTVRGSSSTNSSSRGYSCFARVSFTNCCNSSRRAADGS